MTQQLLDCPQVRPCIEKVRGEGVAQAVNAQLVAPDGIEQLVHGALHTAAGEPCPAPAHEHRPVVAPPGLHDATSRGKPAAERLHRPRAHRDDALLPPLAAHLHLVGQEVHVAQVQPREFRQPHAGGIEELEHREVAERREVVAGRAGLGGGEEVVSAAPVEVGR